MPSKRNTKKEEFLRALGYKLKELRECKGMSQFQLAIEAEIPKNQVGRIERGEINTSIYTLKRIADALKGTVSDFFIDL